MDLTVQGRTSGAWRLATMPGVNLQAGMISTLPALERLVPEWVALWSRAMAPLPLTRPGWTLAWWRTLEGGALQVLTVRTEEDGWNRCELHEVLVPARPTSCLGAAVL